MNPQIFRHDFRVHRLVVWVLFLEPTDLDELQGVIRNPFVFYFPIQRGFSGPIQPVPFENI